MNTSLNLNEEDDQLEVINLTKTTSKPVVVIPTKIIQAAPLDVDRVNRQINNYVDLINIIGYAGGSPYKSVKNLPKVRPFTSVYFIYKRFFKERKKIEKWLVEELAEFYRPGRERLDERSFREWLKSPDRQRLQSKIIEDNNRIETSILAMHKKVVADNKGNEKIVRLSNLLTDSSIE